MVLTSPDNLWSPGTGDDPATSATLGAMMASVQTALDLTKVKSVNQRYISASTTYTKPANLLFCRVRVQAGGGAGGGANSTTANQFSCGGGGASGSYSEAWFQASALTSTVAVTVGARGTGVSGATGNSGTASSFGAYLTTNGGAGGPVLAAGTTHGSNSGATTGPSAGTASGHTGNALLLIGNSGQRGVRYSNGTAAMGVSGMGGTAPYGSVSVASIPGTNAATAGNGVALGSGGSGGSSNGTGGSVAGGQGGEGFVIIEEYLSA